MNVYVIGAGVSSAVGYPLGANLFSTIDAYIRKHGASLDRPDYAQEWPELCWWLKHNCDPSIRAAYITGNVENIFTAMDFILKLRYEGHAEVYRSMRQSSKAQASKAEAYSMEIDAITQPYPTYRSILVWALVKYFEHRHHQDLEAFRKKDSGWPTLRKFGQKICEGDVVITFNYDATMERILLEQGKWTPFDGYGLGNINFVQNGNALNPLLSSPSPVHILHLHGSLGWYANFTASHADGTYISLSTDFLQDLGIESEDASWKGNPASSNSASLDPLVIHPSFFKQYDEWNQYGAFPELWRKAGEALRAANRVFIIGYSLPPADSAALTFLVTNCHEERKDDGREGKVTIVNKNQNTSMRLRQLLGISQAPVLSLACAMDFEKWVDTAAHCPQMP